MKHLLKPSQQPFITTLRQILTAAAVFATRLGTLPPNFSPLGSLGFFQGNPVIFYGSIIIFDWLVGGFYDSFAFTYLGFASYLFWGRLAKSSMTKQALYLPFASFSFFLISNLGVWWLRFPHTGEGLLSCYLLALPFYRNTLLGDLFFGYGYLVVKAFQKHGKNIQLNTPSFAK